MKLTALCSTCGTANAPSHTFCKKCGLPVGATTRRAPHRRGDDYREMEARF